jgi:ribosomal-protein-serine acetyltransferase
MLKHVLSDDVELRLMLPYDAEAYSALVCKDHEPLSEWLPWVRADYDVETAQNFIKRWLQKLADNDGMVFGIFYQGEFAGWINYHFWNWYAGRTELGYWLGVDFQGKGIMTRAVQATTTYALTTLKLNRVDALVDVNNEASAAVVKRLGFTLEGVRRQWFRMGDRHVDIAVYYMLAEDWNKD